MLKVGTVVLGVEDMERAVSFWSDALGYARRDDAKDFVVLLPPDGARPGVAFQRSSAPVQEVPRVHLDLYAGDAADQAAEVSRLVGLGARQVDWPHYPPDPDFVVLADPEGNRFCVIDTAHG
ncbi:VOC family protein [Amycolatopsis sp. NPDC003676]